MSGIKGSSASSLSSPVHRNGGLPKNGAGSRDYTFYYSRSPQRSQAGGRGSSSASVAGVSSYVPQQNGKSLRRNGAQSKSTTSSSSVIHGSNAQGFPTKRDRFGRSEDDESSSYWVEHLATLGVGKQHGIEWPTDGVRKLKQMERNGAIWAQPMILRLGRNSIEVEDENGEIVEKFPLELIAEPTPHQSRDPRDLYNNILLFIVREDRRHRSAAGAEMHVFQCAKVSAKTVVDDIKSFMSGRGTEVRRGLRDDGFRVEVNGNDHPPRPPSRSSTGQASVIDDRSSNFGVGVNGNAGPALIPSPDMEIYRSPRVLYSKELRQGGYPGYFGGSAYHSGTGVASSSRRGDDGSSDISEIFERDVNTLNHCFDEIEQFVGRIQQAAHAQRELDVRRAQNRKRPSGSGDSILQVRAQLPDERQFVDCLQKFKLSFNLLAKLRNHIHEPNASELLHFLFTPLTVILDAARWGVGDPVAHRVIAPLLTREATELMSNCLTSKESDVWLSLGDAWCIPEEKWAPRPMPPPFYPIFHDKFIPYGPQDHRRAAGLPTSLPAPQPARQTPSPRRRNRSRSSSRHGGSMHDALLEMDRLTLEKERIDFEKQRLEDRERRLQEEEQKIEDERRRLLTERQRFFEDQDKYSERSFAASEMPMTEHRSRAMQKRGFTGGGSRGVDQLDSPGVKGAASPPRRTRSYSGSQLSPTHLTIAAPLNSHSSAINGGSPALNGGGGLSGPPSFVSAPPDQSPRQRAFLDDLVARRAKIVQAQHDRSASNQKELTIYKGEYLELMNDKKLWWECRNINNRVGFVPHTIVKLVTPPFHSSVTASNTQPASSSNSGWGLSNGGAMGSGPRHLSTSTSALHQVTVNTGNGHRDLRQPPGPSLIGPNSSTNHHDRSYRQERPSGGLHSTLINHPPQSSTVAGFGGGGPGGPQQNHQHQPSSSSSSYTRDSRQISPSVHDPHTPDYVKQRMGKQVSNARHRFSDHCSTHQPYSKPAHSWGSRPPSSNSNTSKGNPSIDGSREGRDTGGDAASRGSSSSAKSSPIPRAPPLPASNSSTGSTISLLTTVSGSLSVENDNHRRDEKRQGGSLKQPHSPTGYNESPNSSSSTFRMIPNSQSDPWLARSGVVHIPRARSTMVNGKGAPGSKDKQNSALLQEELKRTFNRSPNPSGSTFLPTQLAAGFGVDGSPSLTERSRVYEVANWVKQKGFTERTQLLLEGQTGATLFALQRKQLLEFCGKDEGQRLYSQILVQKNLSGYKTQTSAELSAILKIQRDKADSFTSNDSVNTATSLQNMFGTGPGVNDSSSHHSGDSVPGQQRSNSQYFQTGGESTYFGAADTRLSRIEHK